MSAIHDATLALLGRVEAERDELAATVRVLEDELARTREALAREREAKSLLRGLCSAGPESCHVGVSAAELLR